MYIKAYTDNMIAMVLNNDEEMIESYNYKDSVDLERFIYDWLGKDIWQENNWLAGGGTISTYRPRFTITTAYAPGGIVVNNNVFLENNRISW